MTDLVFVDTETTGLEAGVHQVWEIAYAVNDEPVEVFQVHHNLKNADLTALRINGYVDRVDPDFYVPEHDGDLDNWLYRPLATDNERFFRERLVGNHLVASNSGFDSGMLAERWGDEPWHHRKVDIASMAMPVFGWDRPKGLKDIAERLRSMAYDIPVPDHSAKRDVETLRACFYAVMEIGK